MVSTGVIGAMLPTARILAHLDALVDAASASAGHDFAKAIMTTDTYPKGLHRVAEAPVAMAAGFAKGSGMIHPDMATMLAFLLTDGGFGSAEAGQAALRRVADRSMHRVTVDGDTSPNDTMLLLHAGRASSGPAELEATLTSVGRDLARHIAADGEGATRLITVEVLGARSESEAAHVGRVIATSPLVKTAVAGHDPNWGRVLSAAGRAGVDFDAARARVLVGEFEVYRHGTPNVDQEPAASEHLARDREVRLAIDLGVGQSGAEVWTCDLTADYVRINADYRT